MHVSKLCRAGSQDIQLIGKPNMASLPDSEADQIDQLLVTNGLDPFNKPTGPVCVYHRVMINGRMYFSLNYNRVKRRNSYTVAFKEATDASLCYGEIEKFMQVSTNSPPLALVKSLVTQITGPPHPLSETLITVDSQELLFDNYLTYTEGPFRYIFVSSIIAKCFNLSNDNWNVLTIPVNDIENE